MSITEHNDISKFKVLDDSTLEVCYDFNISFFYNETSENSKSNKNSMKELTVSTTSNFYKRDIRGETCYVFNKDSIIEDAYKIDGIVNFGVLDIFGYRTRDVSFNGENYKIKLPGFLGSKKNISKGDLRRFKLLKFFLDTE